MKKTRILLFVFLLVIISAQVLAIDKAVALLEQPVLSVGRSLDYQEANKLYHWPMTNPDKDVIGFTAMNAWEIKDYTLASLQQSISGLATRGNIACAEPAKGLRKELCTVTSTGPHIALFSDYENNPIWVDDQYSMKSVWSPVDKNVFYFTRIKTNNVLPPDVWVDKYSLKSVDAMKGHLILEGDVRPAYEAIGVYKATIEVTETFKNAVTKVKVYLQKILDGNYIVDGITPDGKSLILKKSNHTSRSKVQLQGEEIGVYLYNMESRTVEQFVAPNGIKDIVKLAVGRDYGVIAYATEKQLFIHTQGEKDPVIINTGTPQSLTITWDNRSVLLTTLNKYNTELPTFFWFCSRIKLSSGAAESFITTWFPMKDISAVPNSDSVVFAWRN